MRCLFLAAMLTVCSLSADSFTFTSCTTPTGTFTPCPVGGLSGPNFQVEAEAGAGTGITPSPFAQGGAEAERVSASTNAAAVIFGPPFTIDISATAQAANSATFHSSGSPRLGLIQFDIGLFAFLTGGGPTPFLTDGVHQYRFPGSSYPVPPRFCGIYGCAFSGMLPFDLGSDFQVSISLVTVDQHNDSIPGGHGTDAAVTFNLLEADGTTPVQFFVVPEPASYGLGLFGLAALALLRLKRKRKSVHLEVIRMNELSV